MTLRTRYLLAHIEALQAGLSYADADCTEYAYRLDSTTRSDIPWAKRRAELHLAHGVELGACDNVHALADLGAARVVCEWLGTAGPDAYAALSQPGVYRTQRWWRTATGSIRGHAETWLVYRDAVLRLHSTPGPGPILEPGDWGACVKASTVSGAVARLTR